MTFIVGVVGAGRVGAVLGAALAAAGHRVVAASGTSAASRARVQALLPTAGVLTADEVASTAELVLIAVPDDALAGVVAGLAGAGALHSGQIVVHTSGAYGVGVLEPAVALGATALALHPAMTFTGTPLDLERLAHRVPFGVTTTDSGRAVAQRLVADLGGTIEWIPEECRVLYHAAVAHGANHLVTLVNEALDLLRDAGVRQPERLLDPILHAALDNTLLLRDAALTGPVSRGDAGTVASHLAALVAAAPASVDPYRALARRTAGRAVAAGRLSPVDAEALLGVLSDEVVAP